MISSREMSDIYRQVILVAALVICVAISIFVVVWAQEPDYRPLVQDIRLVDAVKIADVLDQNRIHYRAEIHSHMLWVSEEQTIDARIALARAGIEIDYPPIQQRYELAKVCGEFNPALYQGFEQGAPIWEQTWAMRALKLVMGGLIIIVLILAIVRPMLRSLIYPEENFDTENQ